MRTEPSCQCRPGLDPHVCSYLRCSRRHDKFCARRASHRHHPLSRTAQRGLERQSEGTTGPAHRSNDHSFRHVFRTQQRVFTTARQCPRMKTAPGDSRFRSRPTARGQRMSVVATDERPRGSTRARTRAGLDETRVAHLVFASCASREVVDLLCLPARSANDLQICESRGASPSHWPSCAGPASGSYEGGRRRRRTAAASPVFAKLETVAPPVITWARRSGHQPRFGANPGGRQPRRGLR